MDNLGADCNWEGWPSKTRLSVNMHNVAVGEPYQTVNESAAADGLLGGVLPAVVFYLPMLDNATSRNRYWTYMAVPVADMQGSREQAVLFRFQQVECAGAAMRPPCKPLWWPLYWDSYWYSRFPGANASDTARKTLETGPAEPTPAWRFYATLLESRRWWAAELAAEGMMQLSLPSPASTNGTWLQTQATHAIVRSMISRQNTWQPRYGVCPGYGAAEFHGQHDGFVMTATAALEAGAMRYARGVVDYHFRHYVRDDGLVWHRAIAVPASARMLTLLALYHSYADGGDAAFLLQHFAKARALAEWLISLRGASLRFGADDPRYGIPQGDDAPVTVSYADAPPSHWYASAAEAYRAFAELGAVWAAVGAAAGRADVAEHGAALLALAPRLRRDLHTSLNKTVNTTASGERCWAVAAEASAPPQRGFRGYSELLHSGAISSAQAADIYRAAAGGAACGASRLLTLGSPGLGGATIATPDAVGFGYGLLQHDMVERFLLHYFAVSAHAYTRGTFTTPESSDVADRDVPPVAYSAAGVALAPIYLKWLLCFEDVTSRTLWLGKALPREWLAPGEAPVVARRLTSRYGRLGFRLEVAAASAAALVIQANVTLPDDFAAPAGGLRLRLRAPLEHKGTMSAVTVGGEQWSAFDAAAETIDFVAGQLVTDEQRKALHQIVATFGA